MTMDATDTPADDQPHELFVLARDVASCEQRLARMGQQMQSALHRLTTTIASRQRELLDVQERLAECQLQLSPAARQLQARLSTLEAQVATLESSTIYRLLTDSGSGSLVNLLDRIVHQIDAQIAATQDDIDAITAYAPTRVHA